jgi:hypothetical protein
LGKRFGNGGIRRTNMITMEANELRIKLLGDKWTKAREAEERAKEAKYAKYPHYSGKGTPEWTAWFETAKAVNDLRCTPFKELLGEGTKEYGVPQYQIVVAPDQKTYCFYNEEEAMVDIYDTPVEFEEKFNTCGFYLAYVE